MKKRIANTAGTAAKRIMPQFSLSRVKAYAGAKCHSENVCIFSRNRSARHAVTASCVQNAAFHTLKHGQPQYKRPPFATAKAVFKGNEDGL